MEKTYLLKLLNKLQEEDGIKDLKKIDDSFLEWLKEYQKLLLHFKDYYDFLGLSIDDWDTYEIGKGSLDSVIIDKTHEISLYGKEKSELYILDNIPLIISDKGIRQIRGSDLIYTYNPYSEYDLQIMKKLSFIGELISVSVCGKNYDKNKQLKIRQLVDFFKEFDGSQNYEESGDNYFYTIFTPRNIKVKRWTR